MKQKLSIILVFLIFLFLVCNCSDDSNPATDSYHTFGWTNYTGIGSPLDTGSPVTGTYSGITITSPTWKSFEADAYFEIKGSITLASNEQYMLVRVAKGSDYTYYWIRGTFTNKLWLRFGSGTYTVTIHKTKILSTNLNYEGAISSWQYYNPPAYTFTVNNTRKEDGRFFYASGPIQSDAPEIISLANLLITGHSTLSNKIRAIHDYVVTNIYYDDASLIPGQRKKQDALSVLHNGTAVCEGYTCLFNALIRAGLGIEAKYINGNNHSWSATYFQNSWRLTDTTWDDPGPNDHLPSNIRWKYFMKDAATFYADHTWEEDREDRKITGGSVTYKMIGYPPGIY